MRFVVGNNDAFGGFAVPAAMMLHESAAQQFSQRNILAILNVALASHETVIGSSQGNQRLA